MASVLAIISKKVFDKLAPGAHPGDVIALDSYTGMKGALARLADGGSLYLVTVRPPERLWLVAILDEPYPEDGTWRAQLNAMPITDITSRIAGFVFESGGGLAAADGALAQALQTPRGLTAGDEALLRGTAPDVASVARTEAELLAQVLAHPDDDAARAVLADWYLERGDPRGEVLLRPEQVAAHERVLLGELYTTTTARVWERGMLRSFKLAREAVATPEIWARAAQHPQLATVREIVRGSAKPPRFRSFLPLAGALETIAIPDAATFENHYDHVHITFEKTAP